MPLTRQGFSGSSPTYPRTSYLNQHHAIHRTRSSILSAWYHHDIKLPNPAKLRFISESPKFQSSILDALVQIPSPLPKKQCEDCIFDFVEANWLAKKFALLVDPNFSSASGKLVVGIRSIVELEGYLREEGLFSNCLVCQKLVTGRVNCLVGVLT